MTKAKIRRHILAPKKIQRQDKILEQHELGKQRLKDKIAAAESHVAPDAGRDVTDADQQLGRRLARAEVVRRLQMLNPNLLYDQSKNWPEFGGLYFDDPTIDPLTVKPVGKRHLCGIPHELVAEFDVRLVINEQIPDPATALAWVTVPKLEGHIPGWRSTILKLVKAGLINLTAAELVFEIGQGKTSERWQKAVN